VAAGRVACSGNCMATRDKSSKNLEKRLVSAATPVFIIDIDRCIAAFNAGCQKLTGWTADEMLGSPCQYLSVPDTTATHAAAASLCPPAEAFLGRSVQVLTQIATKTGETVSREIQYLPMLDEDGEITSILGIVLRQQGERPLAEGAVPERAAELPARLHADLTALRSRLRLRFGPQSLIASSSTMNKVLAQVELAQFSPAFVLLQGEPGTGREHFAKVIHFGGATKAQWFVPIDCKRLAVDELDRVLQRMLDLHSPLTRSGPEPQPGTVYLADVDALPRDLQARLATVFSQSNRPRLRLLCGSSADLNDLVARDLFRRDLFDLISTITLNLPPLRERGSDLQLLAVHFLEEGNRLDSQLNGFADEIWPLFERYHWTGNLAELATVVRESRLACTEHLIRPIDLPFRFRDALQAREMPPLPANAPVDLDDVLAKVETRLIRQALERARYNKTQAAALLNIQRTRLLRRMEQLKIDDLPETAPASAAE